MGEVVVVKEVPCFEPGLGHEFYWHSEFKALSGPLQEAWLYNIYSILIDKSCLCWMDKAQGPCKDRTIYSLAYFQFARIAAVSRTATVSIYFSWTAGASWTRQLAYALAGCIYVWPPLPLDGMALCEWRKTQKTSPTWVSSSQLNEWKLSC